MIKYFYIIITLFAFSCNSELTDLVKDSKITASAEYPGSEVKNLQDSNQNTIWNAGNFGQHWLEFDLNKTSDIEKMYFVVNTSPAANVSYSILVKKDGENEFKNLKTAKEFFNSIDSIKYESKESGIKSVRLVMQNDSSWVGLSHASILTEK